MEKRRSCGVVECELRRGKEEKLWSGEVWVSECGVVEMGQGGS